VASDGGKEGCGVPVNESNSGPSLRFAELPSLATRFRSSIDSLAQVWQLPSAIERAYIHIPRP
jgi:hypothetical protein